MDRRIERIEGVGSRRPVLGRLQVSQTEGRRQGKSENLSLPKLCACTLLGSRGMPFPTPEQTASMRASTIFLRRRGTTRRITDATIDIDPGSG